MTDTNTTESFTAGEFRCHLIDVAESAMDRLDSTTLPPFRRALQVLDNALQETLDADAEVTLPWGAPQQMREAVRNQLAADPDVLRAAERLWLLFKSAGLLTGGLRAMAARRRPTVTDLTGAAWPLVGNVLDVRAFLQSDAAIPHNGLPIQCQEEQLIRNSIFAFATSGLAFPALLDQIATLDRSGVDWERGVIALPASTKPSRQRRGAPQRYYLPRWARLHLIALERFYQTRGSALRVPGSPSWLPSGWQRSGGLSDIVRVLPQSTPRRGRWSDFLAACRLAASLELPPALAAFRSGRLVVAPADADLRSIGLPLSGPGIWAADSRPQVGIVRGGAIVPQPQLLDAMQAILSGLRAHTPQSNRLQRAAALETLLAGASGPTTNIHLVCDYAVHVLRDAGSSATARNRLAGILLMDDIVNHVPFATLGAPEWQEACVELVQACLRPSSMQTMRSRLRLFERFLVDRRVLHSRANWKDGELQIGREVSWQPVVLPGEMQKLADAAQAEGQRGLAVATLVGGGLGLRCSELAGLGIYDVFRGGFGELYVQRSKSDYSERSLPVRLLLPPSVLQVIEAYHAWRLEAAHLSTDRWLVDPQGQPYSPDSLGQAFGRLTERILKRRLGMHALRRSFAAWLLLRWLAAKEEIQPIKDESPVIEEMFSEAALNRVREAFELSATKAYGLGALWILAAFLGHASPEVSVSYYLSSLEWLQFFMIDPGSARQVGIQAAAQIAGVSARQLQTSIPQSERPRGKVPLDTLCKFAIGRIKRADRKSQPTLTREKS